VVEKFLGSWRATCCECQRATAPEAMTEKGTGVEPVGMVMPAGSRF
jgi:hypothetical protein